MNTPSMYYATDDNGYAASWYRHGPERGLAAGHTRREDAERELSRLDCPGEVVTERPPVPEWA